MVQAGEEAEVVREGRGGENEAGRRQERRRERRRAMRRERRREGGRKEGGKGRQRWRSKETPGGNEAEAGANVNLDIL